MNRTTSQFEGLLDRYFEAELADHPVSATYVGLKDGEGKLGRADLEFVKRCQQRRLRTLTALDGINPRALSREEQLDRLALRSRLLRECEDYARRRHTLEPGALDLVLHIVLHELQRGDDDPQRAARNVRSLLKETPRFLAEATT